VSKLITLQTPLDMHLHLRDAQMLQLVAPLTAKTFSGALVMPNLVPPVTTKEALLAYKQRICDAAGDEKFEPYMTLFFQHYSYDFLKEVKEHIIGIKLYPAGITTNSETGVSSLDSETLRPTLEAMSELGIPLCVHGETNGFVMDREKEFMPIYASLAEAFPKLKIIMEHITTKAAVDLLDKYDNLFATITVQHLLITLDDVAGGMLKPHLFCKPIAKRYEDRSALQKVALSAHPKVMFGSDSAPHPKHKKESCGCAAGVFTAPIALQILAQFFDEHKSLENLQAFISDNALNIYGITPPKKEVTLIQKEFIVPQSYNNFGETVVPMYAGETIAWSIVE
jgi:dihydroorotase